MMKNASPQLFLDEFRLGLCFLSTAGAIAEESSGREEFLLREAELGKTY